MGPAFFCCAGQDGTIQVLLLDCTGRVLEQMTAMVMCRLSTRGERDGMNNERQPKRRKGGEGRKDSWYQDWC